ncbi:UPF0481-like protein [Cinnamomum micranthum f. kanehirae]|uniref:UPF0481-like protein n=1 Tax=Cinnamomum micranthum f. kanehirae TaxID=337451 RepID=A0A443P2R2_9MAGN|nr:UPF0481-like protein [Cinnamomum micranthum f. kanehirae]
MKDLTSPQGSGEGIKVDPSSSDIPEKVGDGASVIIEIDDLDRNRAIWIKERLHNELGRLQESSTSFSCSIYRVPHCLRQYNEKVYDPQVISIGPFHYEKRKNQLQEMEERKWRYLQDILSRNGEGSLERYLAVLNKLEDKARKCYSEVIPLDSNSFVEMMLLDACFIIEFFRKRKDRGSADDGIFQMLWLQPAIIGDLIMLENQIPFFILHHLFDLIDGCRQHSLLEIATFLLDDMIVKERLEHSSDIQIQHLLHLMLHTSPFVLAEEKSSEPTDFQKIPCASKLKEAGIKFRKQSWDAFLNIKFQKGVIEIPCMEFWDKLNLLFLNLIAFEQCYCPCKKYITAYIAFMNSLISTGKDVEILCREGIIQNWVGSDGDMVSLFNNMVRELTVRQEDFYLSGICKEINQYCEGTWPKMRATLVHDYFRNRWAIISFFAALFLLLLTLTQTFFSSFPKFAYGG